MIKANKKQSESNLIFKVSLKLEVKVADKKQLLQSNFLI